MNKVIQDLRSELILNSDEKIKLSGERFFREEVKLYGIRSGVVNRIGKEHFKALADQSKENIFYFCEELWKSGILEESFIACNWSYYVQKQYKNIDFEMFERWINRYISNWASCDTLCNHSVGSLVELYPETIDHLKRWTRSENRWMRRAAAVSLIVPAKKGKFMDDIFEIASNLLTDKDDMVRKGYGWMLKVASQAHQKEVYDFVIRNKNVMPRTALRYAIEKMPAELRSKAMEK